MNKIAYPRPRIELAGLFLAAEPPPAVLTPPWWPNDKQRDLTFLPPTLAAAADPKEGK